jgi:hypothetical protein
MPTPLNPHRKLTTGVYAPSKPFLSIPLHTAVCDAQTGDLIAVTGPAGDPASEAYAVLFAQSAKLRVLLEICTEYIEEHWADDPAHAPWFIPDARVALTDSATPG